MASRSLCSAVLRGRTSVASRSLIRLRHFPVRNSSSVPSGNVGNSASVSYFLSDGVSYREIHTGRALFGKVIKCETCSQSSSRKVGDFISLVCCPKCGALEDVPEKNLPNYYQILNHAETYRMNLSSIASRKKQLQKIFHPDLYGNKGRDQQDLSQQYSSLINKALSVLTNPIERGRYLLTLEGVSVDAPDSDLERAMTLDQTFLEEMLNLNERVATLSHADDWREFRTANSETLLEIEENLANAFESNNLEEAQLLLGRMKFYETLQQKLKEMQSQFGVVD